MNGRIRIPVTGPYPWRLVLRYLACRCSPGKEIVEQDRYERHTAGGSVSVQYDAAGKALLADVQGVMPANIEHHVVRLFDPGSDPRDVSRRLRKCAVLGPHVRQIPGLRIPGCWEPFELCVRTILGQQVTVQGAHTIMRRLAARCPAMRAEDVACADLDQLGVPGKRVETIRLLAEQVAAGLIRWEQPWDEVTARLREIPGFGPWTLQYLAIRLGRDADAFPGSDLGLLRAADVGTPRELLRLAESWRPYRAYAAMYLWMGQLLLA
jgi:3-methyladenine DNA glycosylase/8-oxoguanine DNA glycosylase